MTTEEKLRILKGWTKSFAIETSAVGEYFILARFHRELNPYQSGLYESSTDLINDTYSRFKLMIWQLIRNELY
jgi:hypothetical protein